jgi:hypothetical protein
LQEHDPRFPSREHLGDRVVSGYEDSKAGVDLIIGAVDRDDPRPVWFMNWGTDHGSAPSSLKRALDRVLAERGPEGYARFKDKVLLSSDDQFGDHTSRIKPPWRLWIYPFFPDMDGGRWYHRFSPLTARAGGFDLRRDVLENHGPLGALYPTNTDRPQKEGDTSTFLYLFPTGMNDPMHPEWGSWAGRFGVREDFQPRQPSYYWANQRDALGGAVHRDNTLKRWAADVQNDFRARMDWCVKPYGDANHPPVVALNGDLGGEIVTILASPGSTVALSAAGSTDPDGHGLTYAWSVYPEAGTYKGAARITGEMTAEARVIVPDDADGSDIHVILTARDDGEPPLARYRRVIIRCRREAP